jgi:hypothetical protein
MADAKLNSECPVPVEKYFAAQPPAKPEAEPAPAVPQAQPDWSPGDVIASYPDGTIVLDDGTTTWNPERAVPADPPTPRVERCEQALQEMKERGDKYSEMERVARNNGDNCSMDHASGAKHAYFESARLIRAALEDK